MFLNDPRILVVRLKRDCHRQEFVAIHDAFNAAGLTAALHDWCFLSGTPGPPAVGEQFAYAYLIAHGDENGCTFCDNGHCLAVQDAVEEICEYLSEDAIVIAACCWCGYEGAARQIARGCNGKISEVAGPTSAISERQMHGLAGEFFLNLANGCSPREAATRSTSVGEPSLRHHYTVDLDLNECVP